MKDHVLFYRNKLASRPDKILIETYLTDWFGDYRNLEKNHHFIQWLFPTTEQGTNPHAPPLDPGEIETIRHDPAINARFVRAYRLFMDFLGLELLDEKTGELGWIDARARIERMHHFDRHGHNRLRISRIIDSAALFGFPQFQAPLVEALIGAQKDGLLGPDVVASIRDHYIPRVVSRRERERLSELLAEPQRRQRGQPDDQCWQETFAALKRTLPRSPNKADRAAFRVLEYLGLV